MQILMYFFLEVHKTIGFFISHALMLQRYSFLWKKAKKLIHLGQTNLPKIFINFASSFRL